MRRGKIGAAGQNVQALVAHQKQFVLGPEAVRVRPEWEALQLADRLILSLCPKLRVSKLRSRDGKDYYLLGLAVPADTPGSTVERAFPTKHSAEIEDWTGFWAGKWALISAMQCWQDAAGLLGLYHRRTVDGLWISSSPAILGGYLPNVGPAKRLPWRIAHEKGMDWIPAPLTTRENVFKLLALRTIEPVSGAIRPVRFSAAQSTETKDVRLLATTLKTVMGNWGEAAFRERTRRPDGGVRHAHCARRRHRREGGLPRLHRYSRTAGAGRPRHAAATCGADWRRSPLPRQSGHRRGRDAGAASSDHRAYGPRHLPSHRRDVRERPRRSHARCRPHHRGRPWLRDRPLRALGPLLPIRLDRARADSPGDLLRSFFMRAPQPQSLWMDAITTWQRSLTDPIPLDLDWRDRFYLEQRFGAWASTVQRTLDVLDGTFFYPANCLWIAHLLLQYSPRERRMGFAQRSAIGLLAPPLAQMPFNPEPIGTRFKRRLALTYLVTKRAILMMPVPNPFKSGAGKETAST